MKSPHLLNLGNARKVLTNLTGILDPKALSRIEQEIADNAVAMVRLAVHHQRFAQLQSPHHWRHRVSRLYYAAYHAARAVRLFVDGTFSHEVRDHQKFDELPRDFPNRARYSNQLAVLRDDRCTSDYDHCCKARDLVLGTRAATILVSEFLADVKSYLRGRGVSL